jgi:multidrug efflux pump subunit AcrB
MALAREAVGTVHICSERYPFNIVARLPRSERSSINDLKQLYIRGKNGNLVQLDELVVFKPGRLDKTIYITNDYSPCSVGCSSLPGRRISFPPAARQVCLCPKKTKSLTGPFQNGLVHSLGRINSPGRINGNTAVPQ